MKLGEIFKRQSETEDEFGGLEASIGTVMMMDLVPAPSMPSQSTEISLYEAQPESEIESPAVEPRVTGNAQARFAEFGVFEEMHRGVQSDLESVGATLAKVNAAHHQTRDFLNSVYAGIHRTNELELSVARLTSENRALFRQAEHVKRLKAQVDSLTEAFKQRETKLQDTAESLRESLSAARLDLAEANVVIGRMESERQEIMNALATATSHSERAARENEMLRERTINLAADLESVSRKRTDAERKLDEFSSMHERDTADLADIRSRFVNSETERTRLQKQNDNLNSKLIDVTESLNTIEAEYSEQAQRHDLTVQGLRSERDTISARVENALKAEQEGALRIAGLSSELDEANQNRRILEDKLASLQRELDRAGV